MRASSAGQVSASKNAYTQSTIETSVIRPASHTMEKAYLCSTPPAWGDSDSAAEGEIQLAVLRVTGWG
ncbi:hypothetical protein GCM10009799_20280 [Nocardiopsis rhodophaea]|uniref:Uncharacterized protein n=1 Tax=Nocardiopsis rhodophaea TaxID=280238 RepID=A0ABP5EEB1_9ACTN